MQLISDIREIDTTDDLAISFGARIGVDNQQRIGVRLIIGRKGGDIGVALTRRLHGEAG